MEAMLGMDNLGKRPRAVDTIITNRLQNIKERISAIAHTI